MNIDSKKCGKCKTFKPIEKFTVDRKRSDGRHPYCSACRLGYVPGPKGLQRPWTAFADDVLRNIFPSEGPEACQRLLVGRSISAIQNRAYKLGVRKEDADWGLPFQDTAADHRAWQETKVPAYVTGNLCATLRMAA